MKKYLLSAICLMALVLVGCEPNAPSTSNKVVTGTASDVTYNSAVLHGEVNVDISDYSKVEFGIMIAETKAEINARDGERYKGEVLIGKNFEVPIDYLSPETEYYYCAWVFLNKTQYEFGAIKKFTTEKDPTVVTPDPDKPNTNSKAFSVSSTKQVTFSKGNLQYHPANNEWRFAESQLDYIGNTNGNISSTYNGWLDLFGWSTSTTNFGVSTSTSYTDYSGSFVDWGTNKIGNDAPNTWRTLTYDEWNYLRYNRTNASSLCGVAQVNGVNGLIFLPDNWKCPSGVTFKSGFHSNYGVDYYAAYQTFTADQWSKMEAAGAVFLPAAGYRYGTNVDFVQYGGYYWSATENGSNDALYLYFYSDEAYMGCINRYYGLSVRLVKDL